MFHEYKLFQISNDFLIFFFSLMSWSSNIHIVIQNSLLMSETLGQSTMDPHSRQTKLLMFRLKKTLLFTRGLLLNDALCINNLFVQFSNFLVLFCESEWFRPHCPSIGLEVCGFLGGFQPLGWCYLLLYLSMTVLGHCQLMAYIDNSSWFHIMPLLLQLSYRQNDKIILGT